MANGNNLIHLFFPHESNNRRARILHPSSLFFVTILLFVFQIGLNFFGKSFPRVLGYASNIAPSEVIRLTNEKRAQAGLSPLIENGILSQAAQAKGVDMMNRDYWAHFAPDGTSPWKFFIDFGYRYRYAGENLARDFSSASSAVDAWMASPTHRENIMNDKYKEIGIAVLDGNLAGSETTVIIQFFGAKSGSGVASIPEAKAAIATNKPVAVQIPVVVTTPTPLPSLSPSPVSISSLKSPSWISPFSSTKNLSLGITGILLLVLSVDLIIVKRNKIVRVGGRTLAHIAFLGMVLAAILILKAGEII